MKYEEMPAGNELDRLVAEKVLGWQSRWADRHYEDRRADHWSQRSIDRPEDATGEAIEYLGNYDVRHWEPSTQIGHAMEAVRSLTAKDWVFNVKLTDWGTFIEFQHKPEDGGKGPKMNCEGDTPELALCRACLLAVSP